MLALVLSLTANYIIDLSALSDFLRSLMNGNSRVKSSLAYSAALNPCHDVAPFARRGSPWNLIPFERFSYWGTQTAKSILTGRIRDSRCIPWQVFVPVNTNENEIIKLYRVQPSLIRPGDPYLGLGFQIKFPIMF
ncbi:Hypothetical protein FKW44_023349 [Caligus rogercresseyi]|uniref:Uncharacterized protein n=1 Tax=Caligus rogercresseyi TaxID=217165 RepID=A0A7T8GPA1_CALRO|nr:Hypothetical protein FKW44_023349 [Caligus rogercresseyi]